MSPDPQARLAQVNLVVGDMGRAVDFYRLLGLDVTDTTAPWQDHHRTVVTGAGTELELDSSASERTWNCGAGGPGFVLGFAVATRQAVDEIYGRLVDAGHPGVQPPYDAFWGSRYAIVSDPEGNRVGIMSPADDAMRRPPPEPSG